MAKWDKFNDFEVVIRELGKLVEKYGRFPTLGEIDEECPRGLVEAISNQHGGISRVKNMVGMPNDNKTLSSFFEQNADVVAQKLLGRYVFAQEDGRIHVARLTEVAGYEGYTKTSSIGMDYAPGTISISTKYGNKLVDIATGESGHPSCVTLRGGMNFDGSEMFIGPSNLSKALGITKDNREHFNRIPVDSTKLWIVGDGVPVKDIYLKEGNSENCFGFYSWDF